MKITFPSQGDMLSMPDVTYANLFFVDTNVNGNPVVLMFDTGANMTTISQSAYSKINANLLLDKISCGNSAGQTLEADVALVETMMIGNSKVSNFPVLVVPDTYFDFGKDDAGNRFIAQGFLGWDVISQFSWEIDSENRKYYMHKSHPFSCNRNLSWNQFPILSVEWNNAEILMGFDSGHTETILAASWCDHLSDLRTFSDTLTGLGGFSKEDVYIADKIEFMIDNQKILLTNVTILKHDIFGSAGDDMRGLLGADFVQNRKWKIDYPNHHFEIID